MENFIIENYDLVSIFFDIPPCGAPVGLKRLDSYRKWKPEVQYKKVCQQKHVDNLFFGCSLADLVTDLVTDLVKYAVKFSIQR